ncbi:MAG TPA: serine hydrolase domain-containing protein, partial [Gemmatimonadaceae bacterium]|nr:serine hydrolase domain-containing protein [Gemmatimonadaceae bacterium]
WSCGGGGEITSSPATSIAEFEQRLDDMRASSHIAAITAVISKGQDVVWVKPYGQADVGQQVPAADTTVYHLASLTKPFAATVILQLVQEGKVSLDDPVSKYGINLTSPAGTVIRVRHLLSHTSEGVPGTKYVYNGDRFGLLDNVIEQAAGKSFAAALYERIIVPLGLERTAPNPQSPFFAVSGLDRATFEANMARGYTYSSGEYKVTAYPTYFGAAAGLTSSALDYASFSMAMDRDALLQPAIKTLAYTPVVSPSGETFPYGLGWFSTMYKGVRVIWHYGLWTANSSLIVKVPDRGLSFVVLANSDALSSPYPLGAGKLETSPWARLFLDTFVIGNLALPTR